MKNFEIKNIDCHSMFSMVTRNTQSGRSMIEMLGVLAIIGVLSVGGIAGYSKAMLKYRSNKTIEQITQIITNVRTFFASQRNYDGSNNFIIQQKAKLFPDEMYGEVEGVPTWLNAFSGEIGIAELSKTSSSVKDAFAIVLEGNIPQEACIEIATMDWRANSGNSTISLAVNATGPEEAFNHYVNSCTTNARVTCSADMPMSIDKAATACSSSDDNWIYIKFY